MVALRYTVELAEGSPPAREVHHRLLPDVVSLDAATLEIDGNCLAGRLACIGRIHHAGQRAQTLERTLDMAEKAIKGGEVDVIDKPIALQKLLQAVTRWAPPAPVPVKRAARGPLDKAEQTPLKAMPGGGARTAVQFAPRVQSFNLNRPLRAAREEFERSYFEYHLAHQSGSMTRVAEKAGIERTHLYRKLKQLGFDFLRTPRVEDTNEMVADQS